VPVHPPSEPFKLLGVWFTLDLNWKKQVQETLQAIRKKTHSLTKSQASTAQKLLVLKTCIRPAITYAFPVMPYTMEEIGLLDSILSKAAKKAYGLQIGTSNAFTREDINQGGLGIPSLLVEYHTIAIQSLIRALNDESKLGTITGRHLATQLDALSRGHREWFPKYAFRIRQAICAHQSGIEIQKGRE
jgi:hypothetical protein